MQKACVQILCEGKPSQTFLFIWLFYLCTPKVLAPASLILPNSVLNEVLVLWVFGAVGLDVDGDVSLRRLFLLLILLFRSFMETQFYSRAPLEPAEAA